MTLQEAFDFLNFWVNKQTGKFYTVAELELLLDRGQMSLFADLRPRYARSQDVKDALSPFREKYAFGHPDSLLGAITVPTNRNYLDLLDLSIYYTISARVIVDYVSVPMVNEDEKSARLRSQLNPVTSSSPIGEVVGKGEFQLYPKVQYQGEVVFLRRPAKPVFGYTVISGRVIVYNSSTSTELEWRETEQNQVLIKALASIGINLSATDVQQWAEVKAQQNFQNVNKL